MMKVKKNRGVTMIALAITIVLALILAGITINSFSGNDNMISGSKRITNESESIVINTEKQINDLYDELNPPT